MSQSCLRMKKWLLRHWMRTCPITKSYLFITHRFNNTWYFDIWFIEDICRALFRSKRGSFGSVWSIFQLSYLSSLLFHFCFLLFLIERFISEVALNIDGQLRQDSDLTKQQKRKTLYTTFMRFTYYSNRLVVKEKRDVRSIINIAFTILLAWF